ncbi:MAG TPA: hypothetical protein VGH27_04805 [Streptosporangiaceae bacterium]|jgi:hypothetical protein
MTYGTPDGPGPNVPGPIPQQRNQPGPDPQWAGQQQNPPGPPPQWPGQPGPGVPPSQPPWQDPASRPRKPHRWRKRLLITGAVVVVLIAAFIAVGLTSNSNPQPQGPKPTGLVHLHLGQKAVLSSDWTSDGIVSATLYSLQMPFTSQTSNRPDAGDQYAVGRAQVCAGPQGANTTSQLVAFPFELVYPHNQTTGVLDSPDAAREPDLGNTPSTLPANKCVTAYITFEYATNAKPLSVAWGAPDQPAYEWTTTGS